MDDKFDTSKDDAQNYLFCRLKLVNEVNGHSNKKKTIKVKLMFPKLLRQQIRKRYYKTLRTSVIKSPISSSSLIFSMSSTSYYQI